MPDNLDQINVTTRRYIETTPSLVDNIYNQDALNFFLRKNLKDEFSGGSSINEDFIYQSMIGGAYNKGKTFNTTQRQTEQQLRFDIKFMQVGITLFQEDIQVINKGPLAAIKLLKARTNQAYMSLGEFVSISTYLNGVQPGFSNGNVNGLAEALNDGVNQSYDGNTYPTYGQLTRSLYNNALTSVQVNLNGATLEYDTVDLAWSDVFFGSGDYEPNLGVTTPRGLSYFKSKFQTQQRFQDTTMNVGVGFRGLSFNGMTVVATRLAPGSYITGLQTGVQDPVAQTYLQETTGNPNAVYPVGNLNPNSKAAESFFILNARKPFLNYYVSDDAMFGGGFRDFIPSANNTILVAQVLLAHQITVNPRYHKVLFGFTG